MNKKKFTVYCKHKTIKGRRCRRRILKGKSYCCVHNKALFDTLNIGICCFCGNECNPCSQSCGRCARQLSFFY
jgi:hypothetical protein